MPLLMFMDFTGRMVFHELILDYGHYHHEAEEEEQEGPAVNAADLAPAENKKGRKVAGAKRVAKAHEQKVKNGEEKNADNEMKDEGGTQDHDAEQGSSGTAEQRDYVPMSIGA